MPRTVYTIGHSNHAQADFLKLLADHAIGVVCDVRSRPFSRYNPQFNSDELKAVLSENGTAYLWLGKELGARSDDPGCYEAGKVQFDRLAKTAIFRQGLARVQEGIAKGFRIALMCAEKEPLDCHRTILVARELTALDVNVQHILADGSLESHGNAVKRLARMLDIPDYDLFRSPEELLRDTYKLQEDRIAYTLEETAAQ